MVSNKSVKSAVLKCLSSFYYEKTGIYMVPVKEAQKREDLSEGILYLIGHGWVMHIVGDISDPVYYIVNSKNCSNLLKVSKSKDLFYKLLENKGVSKKFTSMLLDVYASNSSQSDLIDYIISQKGVDDLYLGVVYKGGSFVIVEFTY